MKFYVTAENIQKLKRSFLNLKLFFIIDVNQILEDYGYTYSTIDEYGSFIINEKINSLIANYSKSKRIRGIIYSNSNLNIDVINNLKEKIDKLKQINEFVLIDEYNIPRLQCFYNYFNEIIFFPSIKKIRLIECKPINNFIKFQ
jgi:hypothetical protein